MKAKKFEVIIKQTIEKWDFELKLFQVTKMNNQIVYALVEKTRDGYSPTCWYDSYSDGMLGFYNRRIDPKHLH